ncbi:ComEC/Rec2 family competence protein [Qipengyuania sp.]|uniref:ComEC/Rec2 family competence protein n=1 Tax=Qipengyuania sp. TaxID=2004515 RepID=UPI003AF45197
MELEVLPARHGDCMLLHFGSEDDPRLALIDGGPAGVYHEALLPRLEELREQRGIPDGEPLVIDLMMVSHIDDDHVNGIVRFLKDLHERAEEGKPPRFRIRRLWHNSFDDIIGNKESETRLQLTKQFGTASAGEADIPRGGDMPFRDWQVLASVSQGHAIRKLAEALSIPVNPEFGGSLIKSAGGAEVEIDDLKITVLGPLESELSALEEEYDDWLKRTKRGRDSGEALLASFADESVANLSSLVFLIESRDERYLLTGDARGDKILDAIAQCGLADRAGKLEVDLLKVPHHGSDRNVTAEFFEAIPATRYVLSGDGGHGNPERPCIEWIVAARGQKHTVLHFTYPLDRIDRRREELFKGEEWSDEAHGIETLTRTFPDAVKIVAGGGDRTA